MDRCLLVPSGSRGNRHSEDLHLLSGKLRYRCPFSVSKEKNQRPIQFRQIILVSIWADKTPRRIPAAIVRPQPMGALAHNHSPSAAVRFVRASLREFIAE